MKQPICRPSISRPRPRQTQPEPPVRCWAHTPEGRQLPPIQDTELRFLHSTLAWQNQTLGEIRDLLERLLRDSPPPAEPPQK